MRHLRYVAFSTGNMGVPRPCNPRIVFFRIKDWTGCTVTQIVLDNFRNVDDSKVQRNLRPRSPIYYYIGVRV